MAQRMATGVMEPLKGGVTAPIYDISGFNAGQDRLNSNLADYFGPIAQNGYQPMRNQVETYHLPDAYAGKSEYLGATSTNLLLGRNDFLVQSVLPWKFSLNQHVHWHKFQFDRTFPDVSAEESIPRLVTTEKSEGSASLLRRGIALRVEHGFASTPAGRQEYELKLAAIICASSEIIHQTALLALLESPSSYVSSFVDIHRARNLYDYFARDLFYFGCMQKNEHGFFLLDKEVNTMTNPRGISPDTYIMPAGMSVYAQVGDPSEINYNTAGPDARTNLKSKDNIKTLGGKTLMETYPYELDNTMQCIDQLNRDRSIGGHFGLRYWEAGRVDDWKTKYRSDKCNTDIYCAADDSFHAITLRQCLESLKSICGGEDGIFRSRPGCPDDDDGGDCQGVCSLGNTNGGTVLRYGETMTQHGHGGDEARRSDAQKCSDLKFRTLCEIYASSVLGWRETEDPEGLSGASALGYFPISHPETQGCTRFEVCNRLVDIPAEGVLTTADLFHRHGPGSVPPLVAQDVFRHAVTGLGQLDDVTARTEAVKNAFGGLFSSLGVSPFGDMEYVLSSAGPRSASFRRIMADLKTCDFFDPTTVRGSVLAHCAPEWMRKNDTQLRDLMRQIERGALAGTLANLGGAGFDARHLGDQIDQLLDCCRVNFINAFRRVMLPPEHGGGSHQEHNRSLAVLVAAMGATIEASVAEVAALDANPAQALNAFLDKIITFALDPSWGALTLDATDQCRVDSNSYYSFGAYAAGQLASLDDAVKVEAGAKSRKDELLLTEKLCGGFEERNQALCVRLQSAHAGFDQLLGMATVSRFCQGVVASLHAGGDPVAAFKSTASAHSMPKKLSNYVISGAHCRTGGGHQGKQWHDAAEAILADLCGDLDCRDDVGPIFAALVAICCDKVTAAYGAAIGAAFTETAFKALVSMRACCDDATVCLDAPGAQLIKLLVHYAAFSAVDSMEAYHHDPQATHALYGPMLEEVGAILAGLQVSPEFGSPIDGYHVHRGAHTSVDALVFEDFVPWIALWETFASASACDKFAFTASMHTGLPWHKAVECMRVLYACGPDREHSLGFSSGPYESAEHAAHGPLHLWAMTVQPENHVPFAAPADPAYGQWLTDLIGERGTDDIAALGDGQGLPALVLRGATIPAAWQSIYFARNENGQNESGVRLFRNADDPMGLRNFRGFLQSGAAPNADLQRSEANVYQNGRVPLMLKDVERAINEAWKHGDSSFTWTDQEVTVAHDWFVHNCRAMYPSVVELMLQGASVQRRVGLSYRLAVESLHREAMNDAQDPHRQGGPGARMHEMRMPEYGCVASPDAYGVGYRMAYHHRRSDTSRHAASQTHAEFMQGNLRGGLLEASYACIRDCIRGCVGEDFGGSPGNPDREIALLRERVFGGQGGTSTGHAHQPLDAMPYSGREFHFAGCKRIAIVCRMTDGRQRSHHRDHCARPGGSSYFDDTVAYMCRKLSWDNLQEDIERNRPLPVSFLCVRPWRTYRCGSIIACERGENLGRTLYGYADVQCADDVVSKTHVLHFTFQHASVVTNPDAVVTVPDVFISAYVHGESHQFFRRRIASANGLADALQLGSSIVPLMCFDPFYGDEIMTSGSASSGVPHPLFLGGEQPEGSTQNKLMRYAQEARGELDVLAQNCIDHTGLGEINGSQEHSLNPKHMELHFQAPYTNAPDRVNTFTFQEAQYMMVGNQRRVIYDKGHLPTTARRPGSAKVFNGHYAGLCRTPVTETCL